MGSLLRFGSCYVLFGKYGLKQGNLIGLEIVLVFKALLCTDKIGFKAALVAKTG